MGSGNLSNVTITGNGATIMCNNTGGVYCELCSNITIMGITWYQCGHNDSNLPIIQIPALAFTDVSSEICIQDCTFLSSSGCPVYFHNTKGNISITETKFMSNVFDFVFADNVSVNNIFYAGIYILSNAQIVVAMKNSTFDGNGWILNELSDYFYLYSTVIYSSSDISEFLLKNTNFSNNTHSGLYLNDGVKNVVIKILNVNVHDNMGYGINLEVNGSNSDSLHAAAISILSTTFINNIHALHIATGKKFVAHSSINIVDSTFNNTRNSVSQIGINIISFATVTFVKISKCFFHNNQHGAVSIQISDPTECIMASIVFTDLIIYNTQSASLSNALEFIDSSVYIETENTNVSVMFTNVNFIIEPIFNTK